MFKKSVFLFFALTLFLSQATMIQAAYDPECLAKASAAGKDPATYCNNGILPMANGPAAATACRDKAEKLGKDPQTYCGNYELNDFIRLGLNISRWILGIVGSLCLFMFILGGQELLLSGGSSEKVQKGKKIFVAAVVGLLIVLGSFLIIKASLTIIGFRWDWNGQIVQIK